MPRRGENIRKRKDGRWEGRYVKRYSSEGKAEYASVYGKTYFEVKKKLNDFINLSLTSTDVTQKHDISFREVLFLWLESGQLNFKSQTYSKYLHLIESHIIPNLGQMKVKMLTTEIINKYLIEKSKNGRLDGNGGLSSSYLQTITFIINSAISFASQKGYRQPLNGEITKPNIKSSKRSVNVLTYKEQQLLEESLLNDFTERKIGILLSLYTGLRVGEVCGLKWEDIDFDEQTIHIKHTVERIYNINYKLGEQKTILILGDAKTSSSNRIIPIPDCILPVLIKYKKCNGFVIRGNSYEYSDPRTYQNLFHKCLLECNLRSINYHALRHTFATRCIEAGVDIKSLSELLGHSNVNITLSIYVHSSLEHKRNQINRVNFICGQ